MRVRDTLMRNRFRRSRHGKDQFFHHNNMTEVEVASRLT
jgi:hypothetical protein